MQQNSIYNFTVASKRVHFLLAVTPPPPPPPPHTHILEYGTVPSKQDTCFATILTQV